MNDQRYTVAGMQFAFRYIIIKKLLHFQLQLELIMATDWTHEGGLAFLRDLYLCKELCPAMQLYCGRNSLETFQAAVAQGKLRFAE